MARIAISSEGPALTDLVDARFGRAAGFVVIDPSTMETEYIDNGASQVMAQGAGLQAAELVANAGAGVVLTGFVGPKAYRALAAAGIQIGQDVQGMTVKEALEKYQAGEVEFAQTPNSPGHMR